MVFSKHLYMVILSYILLIIAVAGSWYRTYYYTYRPYSRLSFLDYFTFFYQSFGKTIE